MTEMQIIKALFKAFSTKEEITVSVVDGCKYTGVICSFDGEIVMLNDARFAIVDVVTVDLKSDSNDQSHQPIAIEKETAGFIQSLLAGDRATVELYFAEPNKLLTEGFSEDEVAIICARKTKPLPWSDNEQNRTYNQARRIYDILGTKDGVAQTLFEDVVANSTSPKLAKKAIGSLLEIYCAEAPGRLPAFWQAYKTTIAQEPSWLLKLARALIQSREYTIITELVAFFPSSYNPRDLSLVVEYIHKYGSFALIPNELEIAIIAGDIPQLRLIATDADKLSSLGYSLDEIKQTQAALTKGINFTSQDDYSVAKRLYIFQENKNHSAEFYFILAMLSGKKPSVIAENLIAIYSAERRAKEVCSIFENYIANIFSQRTINSGIAYISALLQCNEYLKAKEFWKNHAELLDLDNIILLYILLQSNSSDEEIQDSLRVPFNINATNADFAMRVLLLLADRPITQIISTQLAEIYNTSFVFLDKQAVAKLKEKLTVDHLCSLDLATGAGIRALLFGFSNENTPMNWFRKIAPMYSFAQLTDVVRKIIAIYVNNELARPSDIYELLCYVQNCGETIPLDLLEYLRPQFSTAEERNAWLDQCVSNEAAIDETVFVLFCQTAEDAQDNERQVKLICSLSKRSLSFAPKVIEAATDLLSRMLSAGGDVQTLTHLLDSICALSHSAPMEVKTLGVLFEGFICSGQYNKAFVVGSILQTSSSDEVVKAKACNVITTHHGLKGITLHSVLSDELSSSNIYAIDEFIDTWGKYFHITESDVNQLSEVRDYYDAPEKWSEIAKEALAKHLIADKNSLLYWQLLGALHKNASETIKVNIQFHKAIAENAPAFFALQRASRNGLSDYAIAILKYILAKSSPDNIIKTADTIIQILTKWPDLLNASISEDLLLALHENTALRSDLQAWESVLDIAMEIAFIGNAVNSFAEHFSQFIDNSYPEINCRYLCNLLLHKPDHTELILSALNKIKSSAPTPQTTKIVVEVLSNITDGVLTEVQKDILQLISQCKKSIDETVLYAYFMTAVANKTVSRAHTVLSYLEKYAPTLQVFDDIKKYSMLLTEASDDSILALYNSEFDSLHKLNKPERIAKVIINLVPGELYLKAKGKDVASAFELGTRVLTGYSLREITSKYDTFKALLNSFSDEKYPGLATIFMKCCFTRQWSSFIAYDLENDAINNIIKSDTVVKSLLFKRSYEILKSAVLVILDAPADNTYVIDRTDAMFAACGGINRSKNYLRRIQRMDEADRDVLSKVFAVRIESKTLRESGIVGTTILSIPDNEKVGFVIGMLDSRNLAEIFNNNACVSMLALMPDESAVDIANIYATFFHQGADNLFKRYLQKQNEGGIVFEFAQGSAESTQASYQPIKLKYLHAQKEYDASSTPVPKALAKKFESTKAAYLYEIVKAKNQSAIEELSPAPMDYLSTITWLFNRYSENELKTYLWSLDASLLIPCLSHIMTMLEQYSCAFNVASNILMPDWKDAALQVLYRSVACNITCDEDRMVRDAISSQIQISKNYLIGKFIPATQEQKPQYIQKMNGLKALAEDLLNYMAFCGLDVSSVQIDAARFAKSIDRYSQEKADVSKVPIAGTVADSTRDEILSLIKLDALSQMIANAAAIKDLPSFGSEVPEIAICLSTLKHLIEKESDLYNKTDLLLARNLVRWIYLLTIEKDGFSREYFSCTLELISAEDGILRSQWTYILTNLYQYFECFDSLQHLARLAEVDIGYLRNIALVKNPRIRILRKEDVDEWNTIIDVLSNIAGIDFSKMAESEQTLRLISCRTKLLSIIEKKTSSIFDQIGSKLLILINSQIALLRHNPELSISVLGEDNNAVQAILWEEGNRTGKLYAVVTNIGGADCKQVSLVSYINTKRVKECWINAIYVGEKIPFEQVFTAEDLSNGAVTWDIELSYFDEEKNKVVVTVHKSTATVTIGVDPLNRGHISTGNPATGKNFVGRNRELALLRNHFSDISEIPSLLIRGLRRSGKSSILLRLTDDLKKNDGILVAPVDGQSIAGDIRRAFVEKVLDGIRINYRSNPMCQDIIQTQFTAFANEWIECMNATNWIGLLDKFYYELSQLFGRKILILIDEMESIFYSNRFASVPEEESLYSALRSLIQRRENYVSFVFCGSDKLLTSCLEQRRESQMFQTLQFLEVGRMNSADIREIFRMQSEKYDVRFTADAVDTIWQYTHGLVWYAKLLGYIVINNILEDDLTVRENINRCDISNAVQRLIDGEIGTDKYDLVDANLNAVRSAIVRAMAGIMPDFNKEVSIDEIGTALKLMQIEEYTDPRTGEAIPTMNDKTLKQHLFFLEKMQFVVANASKTKYAFAAELYRLFFRKEKKLHVFEEKRLKP